jgi:hypothetical protein
MEVKLFHGRNLDVSPQEREVIDIPRELDVFLLDAMGFHRSERIVGAVLPVVIEVGEIF